ncbi:DUF4037 domain-containing protein [Microbacterium jejuense]|uniref:DUF4037 domain-containing protein n=1 Tax=Microbacterium jejuense TaxID=1263637 RepID=UPI0031E9418A
MPHDDGDHDGRRLAERYFVEVVRPLVAARWPGLSVAAGRLGSGSDVLGLDDATSRDHDWGLRLSLFVDDAMVDDVDRALASDLPETAFGLPTRFPFTGEDAARHHVEVASPRAFAMARLGLDAGEPMSAVDWLSVSGQAALEIVAGPVFADEAGELTRIRTTLRCYPDDVRRHVIAVGWQQIAEELPLLGRAAQVGDDLGSRIIAGRVAATVVHLAFVIARSWMPYAKWSGTLLRRLPGTGPLIGALDAALRASDGAQRQARISGALEALLDLQRASGLPAPAPATEAFWDRPFRHPRAEVIEHLRAEITDAGVRALAPTRGCIEQRTADVALLTDPAARRAIAAA